MVRQGQIFILIEEIYHNASFGRCICFADFSVFSRTPDSTREMLDNRLSYLPFKTRKNLAYSFCRSTLSIFGHSWIFQNKISQKMYLLNLRSIEVRPLIVCSTLLIICSTYADLFYLPPLRKSNQILLFPIFFVIHQAILVIKGMF